MILLELLLCMVFSALFAGTETGLMAANRMLVEKRAAEGGLSARAALFLLRRPQRLLGTTLIGTNLGTVSASVLVTTELARAGWSEIGWAVILAMTFVFLVVDDLIPKSFFRQHADTAAVGLAPVLVAFFWLFLPVYSVLNAVVQVFLVLTRQHVARREEVRSQRDLDFLVNLVAREVGLSRADQRLMNDILHFRDQSALEVMTPLHRLPVVPVGGSVEVATQVAVLARQPFVPVVDGRFSDVVGYIDAVELFARRGASALSSVRDLMKPAVFYPETVRIPDLLRELNTRGLPVAFLADEFGGASGLITAQQIVGDIFHYIPRQGGAKREIEPLPGGAYRVAGGVDLEDVSAELGVHLQRGLSSTVGGFVCERLGRIPVAGAIHRERGLVFTVRRADLRHIEELEVSREAPRKERPPA